MERLDFHGELRAAMEARIEDLTDELDAMDRDGRFDTDRDRYHEIMVERSDLFRQVRT